MKYQHSSLGPKEPDDGHWTISVWRGGEEKQISKVVSLVSWNELNDKLDVKLFYGNLNDSGNEVETWKNGPENSAHCRAAFDVLCCCCERVGATEIKFYFIFNRLQLLLCTFHFPMAAVEEVVLCTASTTQPHHGYQKKKKKSTAQATSLSSASLFNSTSIDTL